MLVVAVAEVDGGWGVLAVVQCCAAEVGVTYMGHFLSYARVALHAEYLRFDLAGEDINTI